MVPLCALCNAIDLLLYTVTASHRIETALGCMAKDNLAAITQLKK